MKIKSALLCALVLLPVTIHADDFSLSDGREYKGVTVSRVEADGIVVLTQDGVEKLPFNLLPKEAKDAYPYIPKATPPPVVAPVPATPVPGTVVVDDPAKESANTPAAAGPSATPEPVAKSPARVALATLWQRTGSFYITDLLVKSGMVFLVLVAALCAAAFLVKRLLAKQILDQKRAAFDAANALQFQAAYMEFFAIWKLWNHSLEHSENALPDHGEFEIPHATRWELLNRAFLAESSLEGVFLKLAGEGQLKTDEVEIMGRFRQAFQTLGDAIKNNKPLAWNDPGHPEYLAFKRLAVSVSLLLDGDAPGAGGDTQTGDLLPQITSNRWERRWNLTDAEAQAKGITPS